MLAVGPRSAHVGEEGMAGGAEGHPAQQAALIVAHVRPVHAHGLECLCRLARLQLLPLAELGDG